MSREVKKAEIIIKNFIADAMKEKSLEESIRQNFLMPLLDCTKSFLTMMKKEIETEMKGVRIDIYEPQPPRKNHTIHLTSPISKYKEIRSQVIEKLRNSFKIIMDPDSFDFDTWQLQQTYKISKYFFKYLQNYFQTDSPIFMKSWETLTVEFDTGCSRFNSFFKQIEEFLNKDNEMKFYIISVNRLSEGSRFREFGYTKNNFIKILKFILNKTVERDLQLMNTDYRSVLSGDSQLPEFLSKYHPKSYFSLNIPKLTYPPVSSIQNCQRNYDHQPSSHNSYHESPNFHSHKQGSGAQGSFKAFSRSYDSPSSSSSRGKSSSASPGELKSNWNSHGNHSPPSNSGTNLKKRYRHDSDRRSSHYGVPSGYHQSNSYRNGTKNRENRESRHRRRRNESDSQSETGEIKDPKKKTSSRPRNNPKLNRRANSPYSRSSVSSSCSSRYHRSGHGKSSHRYPSRGSISSKSRSPRSRSPPVHSRFTPREEDKYYPRYKGVSREQGSSQNYYKTKFKSRGVSGNSSFKDYHHYPEGNSGGERRGGGDYHHYHSSYRRENPVSYPSNISNERGARDPPFRREFQSTGGYLDSVPSREREPEGQWGKFAESSPKGVGFDSKEPILSLHESARKEAPVLIPPSFSRETSGYKNRKRFTSHPVFGNQMN